MKLCEIREAYETLSGTLSSVTRSLVLAGIGIIWIFVKTSNDIIDIPDELISPLFLFVISICCDLIQYFYQSIIWYIFYLYHKLCNKKDEQDEVSESEKWNIISWILLAAKVILMIVAYIKIGLYFWELMPNNSVHAEKTVSSIISNNMSAPLNTSIFGMSEELASIVIPTGITIIIFCLSQILSFCYAKCKQYNETKKYRDIVFKWTEMIIPTVRQQAEECKKLSEAVNASEELQPERLAFSISAAEKINCIPADKLVEIFTLRSSLRCIFQDKQSDIEKNTYNIISLHSYLSQLQGMVEENYKSYQIQTIDLGNEWNKSYKILTEYISANMHTKYFEFLNNPDLEIKSHIDCYKKIVEPLIRIFETAPGEVGFSIRHTLNELQIIEKKRESLFKGYETIFNDLSNTINSSIEDLVTSVDFFKEETRIKWL